MDKKQVFEMMRTIALYYDRFDVSKEKVEAWTAAFRDQDFDEVMEKLKAHAMRERFAPTIAELVTIRVEQEPSYLDKLERMKRGN